MKSVSSKAGIACTAFLLAMATSLPVMMISSDVYAQEITASIQGTVLTPSGQPAAGVSAVVTDTRDGGRQTATADSRGVINFRSVAAGGPYTVRISGEGYQDLLITDLYTDVAGTSTFTVTLEGAATDIEEVVVTAAQIQMITTASGPSSTFSLEQISAMPSTQRQIRDIVRLDPRISVGETGDGGDQSGAISCAGGSSRTNSFTIDGVRATDNFGLNLSGNLARFTFPIPFDTVSAAAVEFAPVSVEYGQFSGCNINVVTKSGENEFHGGGFYLFNDDGMTNDKIEGKTFDQGTFERENYGVEFSGPIIKDKLFFYTAYEKFETATVNVFGSADDSSFPRSETSLTTDELSQVQQILQGSYGRDPGTVVRNLPVESERIFARIDWNINDSHRLEGTYSSLEETTTIGDDIGTGRGGFTFSDNFHLRGSDSETLALRLYSNWTDNLSTEFRYSTQEVIDQQNPVGGGEQQDAVPKPRIAISAFGVASEFFGQDFVSGPGTFRSANSLATEKDQLKFKFDYQMGDHLITGGYEYETLDVFNLFIINATGTFFFNSIEDLADGNAYEIISANSFTGDPNDAAAIYARDINSLFLQDKWQVNDSMELIFGLRYDWYETDDLPLENPNYIERYGFTNQVSYDGLDIIQPRIGLNYTLPEKFGDTRMSLGYGVFSGNDPTVWFSNAYQNFGGALGRATATGAGCDPSVLTGLATGSQPSIPDCVLDAAQAQALNNAGAVNATDPNFDLPTATRYSFGLEHNTDFESEFLSDWNLRFDLIYSDLEDQVAFVDLSLEEVGNAPDGRPIYAQVNPQNDGCDATFLGPRFGFENVTEPCFGGATQDIFFTNQPGNGGHTFTLSIQGNKEFSWGNAWSMNVSGGYSYNESEIANPGTSFTAAENFRAVVAEDIVNLPVGPSLRNVPHNFVIATVISNEFWSGYRTSLGAFFQRRSGAEISPVFSGGYAAQIGDTGGVARNLVYIPTDENDPLVTFGDNFDTDAFFSWVNKNDLKRGRVQKKGGLDESWATDLDIRIQQEIPFFGKAKATVYLDIENFLNFINDDWGAKRYINTTNIQSAVAVVDATINEDDTYTYNTFTAPVRTPDSFDSLYRIQLGIRADF
jgi:hypothetical protein